MKNYIGKGELDAYFGLLFDGLSKVLVAVGVLIGVLGVPKEFVYSKIVPAMGLSIFLGNTWYFYEAYVLSKKESRYDVTSQPFGIGAGQVFGWLFLIMAPIYWKTGDYNLAWQVGLAGCFLGGVIEIFGGLFAVQLKKFIPRSALLGNLASSAFVWLTTIGMIIVYDKIEIALIPLFIYIIFYYGKLNKTVKLQTGLVVVVIGTILAWVFGYKEANDITSEVQNIKFYYPTLAINDVFQGIKNIRPYLPVIIPMQLGNFITTLQSLEVAAKEGDRYPVKKSMFADGLTTIIASLFGSPFPTTVYYGHTTWKKVGARSMYSLWTGITYLILTTLGLVGLLLAIIPYEVTVVLLVAIGIDVCAGLLKGSSEEYSIVFFVSLIPVLAQYIYNTITGLLSVVNIEITEELVESMVSASVYFNGIELLANGALLTSLLLACFMAYIIKTNYYYASIYMFILSITTFIGLTHGEKIELFPEKSYQIGVAYLIVAIFLFIVSRKYGKNEDENKIYR